MARKLKTYITNLGFFELALAAPSMKAALEAWGMGHNAFHQGFAKQTHDAKIVAATMAKPGVVLKRPVGGKGAFSEKATLPKDWTLAPYSELPNPRKKGKAEATLKPAKRSNARKANKGDDDDVAGRAAIISFEKEKARREREREKETAKAEERDERDRVRRARESEQAEVKLERAQARHDKAMVVIEKQRDKLDRRARNESERWDREREALKATLHASDET